MRLVAPRATHKTKALPWPPLLRCHLSRSTQPSEPVDPHQGGSARRWRGGRPSSDDGFRAVRRNASSIGSLIHAALQVSQSPYPTHGSDEQDLLLGLLAGRDNLAAAITDLAQHGDHLVQPTPPTCKFVEFRLHQRMPLACSVIQDLANLVEAEADGLSATNEVNPSHRIRVESGAYRRLGWPLRPAQSRRSGGAPTQSSRWLTRRLRSATKRSRTYQ